MTWQFLRFERIGRSDAQITLRKHRWFRKPVEVRFRGNCTVWRNVETGRRAGTHLESYLSDIWTVERWSTGEAV